jgi:CRISPR-associated protein Cmr2
MTPAISGVTERPPTLSVGIGIGHVMEVMGDLLDLGRRAERAAKDAGRNALAVLMDKRSGGLRTWAASWDQDPVSRLEMDIALLDGPLATGKVYEIGALLRRLPAGLDGATASMLGAYAKGILVQSRGGKSALPLDKLDLFDPAAADHKSAHRRMAASVDRFLIAKALREAGLRSGSHPAPAEGSR